MSEISVSDKDATVEFGMITQHGRMPIGEYRFRLKCEKDSTGYIRTQTIESCGWQNSHFHNFTKETYIVQQGFMIAAELKSDGSAEFLKFEVGDIYTTPIKVVHNIYLPISAVIHTVKHGNIPENKGDWNGAEQGYDKSQKLDQLTKYLSEIDALAQCKKRPRQKRSGAVYAASDAVPSSYLTSNPEDISRYSTDYKHFDVLLWQMPAWSSVIFTFFVGMMIDSDSEFLTYVMQSVENPFSNYLTTPSRLFWSLPMFFIAICLFVFALIFYRLHKRQISLDL